MKKYVPVKLVISALSFVFLVANVSCEEDEISPYEPDRLIVSGPAEVAPGATATYYTSLYENETYSWTVPTGATIIEGEGTSSIDVSFTAAGSGDVTVAGRGINGTTAVTVVATAPEAEVALDSTISALAEGGTANVLITFDQAIATAPAVTLVPGDEVTGSTISAVEKVDDNTFQVTYTAGAGDGTDRISVDKAVTTETLGAVAMDTVVTFDGYAVDNTSATGKLSASDTPVSDSTMVTLSAVFSEPLSTSDSVKVSVTGLSTATAYVSDASMATEDGLTWTYDFQPTGAANELVTVSVGGLPADRAGNPTEAVEPIVIQIKNEE